MHTGNSKVVDEIIRITLYLYGTDIGFWALRSSETVEIIFLKNIIYMVSTNSASWGISKSMPLQVWSIGQQHDVAQELTQNADAQALPMPSWMGNSRMEPGICVVTLFCDSGFWCSPSVTSAGLNLTACLRCFKSIFFYHGIIINCHNFNLKYF